MQYWLEQFGVAVAAVTGVLAARGKQVDLFGVLVLALVTAFGGGTLRDLMLDAPVFWIGDPIYLWTATTAAVAWFCVARLRPSLSPSSALLVADAYALALFTIVGVKKALGLSVSPSIAVGMGVITGVAGGILRDVLLGTIPLVFRREIHLYATAAIAGAVVYVLLARWLPGPDTPRMIAAAGVVLLLRLAGIRWKIGLPEFRTEEGTEETESWEGRS